MEWGIQLDTVVGGNRHGPVDDGLFVVRESPIYHPSMHASYPLWRRVSWAVLDAWLFWERSMTQPNSNDPRGAELVLAATGSIALSGMYRAGTWARWHNYPTCLATLNEGG